MRLLSVFREHCSIYTYTTRAPGRFKQNLLSSKSDIYFWWSPSPNCLKKDFGIQHKNISPYLRECAQLKKRVYISREINNKVMKQFRRCIIKPFRGSSSINKYFWGSCDLSQKFRSVDVSYPISYCDRLRNRYIKNTKVYLT